ncbi:MAG TPA: GYD domain-containing protein [Xanthobacteraceae bacterium]|nr:GYD domain-containing protein [Xanthobacteraceae bacterium]
MLFIMSLNFTEQGIRAIKDAPKRAKTAHDIAKKVGVDIKQLYLTSGEHDLVALLETPNGDNVAKFALAIGALGNVRSRTARAWTEPEFHKLVSELP